MSEPLLPCAWLFIISFWIERWVGWLLTLHLSNYQIVCWLRTLHSIGVISSHLILHLSIVRLKISHLTSLIYVSPLSTSRSTSHFVVTILIGSLRQAPISSTLPTQDGNLSDCGQHNLQFLSNKMEMLAIFHRFEIEDLCFKRGMRTLAIDVHLQTTYTLIGIATCLLAKSWFYCFATTSPLLIVEKWFSIWEHIIRRRIRFVIQKFCGKWWDGWCGMFLEAHWLIFIFLEQWVKMVAEAEAYFHEGMRRVDSLCFIYVHEIAENGEL